MEKYQKILDIVNEELSCSAHKIDHVMRVYNLCKLIASGEEDVDIEVLSISALLHDIARVKESKDITGKVDHAILGGQMAEDLLSELGYEDAFIKKVKHCITTHRFRTGNLPNSKEAKILYDADKIDAIGAVGIARCFMLSGQFRQRLMIDEPLEEYIKNNITENGRLKDLSKHSPIIEYELKFKKIPSQMHTTKGKEIALERLEYMNKFYERLKNEITGTE
ncbi:HD domain-containing protein [Clostridiaceae bacterium M8S5]|nr:HD domain-containing protein [Clostridiaceae bacterium M8S5]